MGEKKAKDWLEIVIWQVSSVFIREGWIIVDIEMYNLYQTRDSCSQPMPMS